jgi:4-amino-4-deoxy-L-arabinose transferase-like glycosyltransferase
LILAVAISGLYLFHLDGVGLLGPDEPRYAAIGRAMAENGDLITPRLWGSPWFEKPPLLYWMVAAGTGTGVNPDLAARFPVALLSLAFLAMTFFLLRHEFDIEVAAVSTALLATCAGWVTSSGLCSTDVPLAVCFSLAVFLALPLLGSEPSLELVRWRFLLIGVCFGLGMLAKGLVPLALALPFLWFLRRFWRRWWVAFLSCAIIAGPWYAAVYVYNGNRFLEDFFWKHHIQRLYSASLHHLQPWYFYFPVLLAGVFPWTPLIGLLAYPQVWRDQRSRFLACVFCFGFLLFSISLNKLPGYLLPLLPALFVLVGLQFEKVAALRVHRLWLLPCALLISAIPMLARALPQWLSVLRFSSLPVSNFKGAGLFYMAVPVAAVFLARRLWAVVLLVLCVCCEGIYLKETAYPVLDREVSARGLWREIKGLPGTVCDAGVNREWRYGLAFYRGSPLPFCQPGKFDFALRPLPHGSPVTEPQKQKKSRSTRQLDRRKVNEATVTRKLSHQRLACDGAMRGLCQPLANQHQAMRSWQVRGHRS